MLDALNESAESFVFETSQKDLEKFYSKYQTISCIKNEFIEHGFDKAIQKVGIPVPFGLDLLVQIYLHKRAKLPVLVGLLRKHFEHDENPAQACADMIEKAAREDLMDYQPISDQFIVRWSITEDVQERINRFQYPLPMIEAPEPVTNNKETGYQTIRGSLILKQNHHDKDICLDHINRVNQIPLALNTDVVAFTQNNWKNLDKKKPGEDAYEFQQRRKAFENFDRNTRDIIQGLLLMNDRFWLTHKYDKRGRTYCQGYHVSYQGNDWQKACVEFADKEPLNQE